MQPDRAGYRSAPWVAILLCVSSALTWAEDAERPPEFIAEQKADLLYRYFLDGMMPSPEFHTPNLTFRISNDIWGGSDGTAPEFYMLAFPERKLIEIRYPAQGSIYTAAKKYFLDNPTVTIDQLKYWPDSIRKRIPYEKCPDLATPIAAVEQYVRTSVVASGLDRLSRVHYLVGYARDNFELTYRVMHEEARPVPELLAIRDIALRCARDLPTIEEEERAEELKRKQEQADFIKNFKGPLVFSPPEIVLKHGSHAYQSTVGTSCWSIGKEGLCNDVFGTVTSREPIVVRRRDRIFFEMPLADWLESMEFATTRVTSRDLRKQPGDERFTDIYIWEKEVRTRPMSEKQRQSIVIDKPPGEYLLTINGVWNEYGDAAHAFYLKVIP
jgi:hypothetical protein